MLTSIDAICDEEVVFRVMCDIFGLHSSVSVPDH